MPDQTNWRNKLDVLVHDPAHKPFKIAGHEEARKSLLTTLGIHDPDEGTLFDRSNDWKAAAADRYAFPKAGVVYSDWAANKHEFRHPLTGSRITMDDYVKGRPKTADVCEDWIGQALKGVVKDEAGLASQYIRVWRMWSDRCAREKHPMLAYAVADTRIPDHTIWAHNSVASAFASAGGRPAFLIMQTGPVQDFIKQARRTLDLWAGSYLLSLLTARGMLAIADEIGPDSIIFPNLKCVPLADWHWFNTGIINELQRASHHNELLTPNLPNRFLALVSSERAEELAEKAEKAIKSVWMEIAESVRGMINAAVGGRHPNWDMGWSNQIERFPVVDYEAHEWVSAKEAFKLADEGTPPMDDWPSHPLNLARKWIDMMPEGDREAWQGGENIGFAWALNYAMADWRFAARKNARRFKRWDCGKSEAPKDDLNGRDEILGGGTKDKWEPFWESLRREFPADFKGRQRLGAVSVVKRLFHKSYLEDRLGWDKLVGRSRPRIESVPRIALIDKSIDEDNEKAQSYYAIIAMDGDNLGRIVSGEMAPPLTGALSKEMEEYFKKYWRMDAAGGLQAEKVRRPLSPSYHASLSEALGNFSLYAAQQIVQGNLGGNGDYEGGFGGQLIYAGGDDALAMVPAELAMDCANALRIVFAGLNPDSNEAHASIRTRDVLRGLFDFPADGFVRCLKNTGAKSNLRPNWPLMMPGVACSIGIAVGHVRTPMQDVIQAARNAEAAAKRVEGKNAFCLTAMRRSGETTGIAAGWDSGAHDIWNELEGVSDKLAGGFPYKLGKLLRQVLRRPGKESDGGWEAVWSDSLIRVVAAETIHTLSRQSDRRIDGIEAVGDRWTRLLTGSLTPKGLAHFWMTWAFIRRISGGGEF